MRIYNRYLVILAMVLLLTTVALSTWKENRLGVYYSIYVIESLIITELFVYLSPKARRGLSAVSVMLFAAFSVIVGLKVWQIILPLIR